MKVLIAYDGSDCSNVALDDLHRAGFPNVVEARVFSVVEETVESVLYPVEAVSFPMAWYPLTQPDCLPAPAKTIEQTHHLAGAAAERLRQRFPAWTIDSGTAYGVAGPTIIDELNAWNADLVVMGSHGRNGFRRFLLGSVSQHVVNHAPCAVRITRTAPHERSENIRLLVAIDGSRDAAGVIHAVASRAWPAATEARVVGAVDEAILSDMGAAAPRLEKHRLRIAGAIRDAARDLRRGGLVASQQILNGEAGPAILDEAERWSADCVFLGARGVSAVHRVVLGSVSSAVAADARCSVEVIRRPPPPDHASADCSGMLAATRNPRPALPL